MKQIVYFFTGLFLFSILLSSCKSHERCPAYGQTTPSSNAQEIPS